MESIRLIVGKGGPGRVVLCCCVVLLWLSRRVTLCWLCVVFPVVLLFYSILIGCCSVKYYYSICTVLQHVWCCELWCIALYCVAVYVVL